MKTQNASHASAGRAGDGQWRTPLNQARSEAVAQILHGIGATSGGKGR